MVNVGVIGCGKIAQVRHLPEYADNEECKIAGVYDINGERAGQIAEQYHAKAYASVEELLADQSIEAVSVCTANATHAEITIAALKAGKHVLCEKPMAISLEQCVAMVAEAKRNQRFLMIGHNQRLAKAHAEARKLVEKGEIGKILTFRTTFGHQGPETWTIDPAVNWFFDKKSAVFGAMADLGIHKTDLIQFLTGQKVSRVNAYLGTLDKRDKNGNLIGVDDNAICIYQMTDGTVGTMTASWTMYGLEDNSTVLYGTDGVLYIYDHPEYSIRLVRKNGEQVLYALDQIQTNDHQIKSGVIDLWISCIEHNTPPEISGEDALHAMKAVFAALRSAETGKTVEVE